MNFNIIKTPEEYDYHLLEHYVKKYKFFKDMGYNARYLNHKNMNDLLNLAYFDKLTYNDFVALKNMFVETFNKNAYDENLEIVEKASGKVNEIITNSGIEKIIETGFSFKKFNEIYIKVTMFGPGGSYDSNSGGIILRSGKPFDDYVTVIFHEYIHIGIQESVVEKYKVSHIEKEFIVDNIIKKYLDKYFENYQIQSFANGENESLIKHFEKTEFSIENLCRYFEEIQDK